MVVYKALPVIDYPFMFDGITEDEKSFELKYLNLNYELVAQHKYKPLVQQIIDGDITEVPEEYLSFAPSYIFDNTWRYTIETYLENH